MNKLTYIILLALTLVSCSGDDTPIRRVSIVMGSTIEIQVRGVNEVTAQRAINAAFAEARRIDTLFSTYLTGNPMWEINNIEADRIIVKPEIFSMLKKCDELWKLTNGAFDPAIGKIIDLIGFEKGDPRIPQPEKVKEALAKAGWKKIELQEPNFLIKPGGIKLSFNACVPGYAADKVANLLYNFGIKEFLINIGGEIFASGENWTIGIQHPRRQNELIGALNVNKMGISTSGDYEQYFKTGGKRITHIFNPLTGLPANECEAVTIIARDALTADALSTAVFVLGPVEGMKLIEKLPDVEGIIVDTLGVIHQSSNFEKYLSR